MKKLLYTLPLLVGFLLTTNSCSHHHDYEWYDDDWYYDDYYHQDYYDHHYDYHHYDDHYYQNTYNYIRNGRWYPASHDGLSRCEYESYIKFNDWEILHYDCGNYLYDSGTYEYHNGYIRIEYRNHDIVEYHINKACDNELILRKRNGQELHFVRL